MFTLITIYNFDVELHNFNSHHSSILLNIYENIIYNYELTKITKFINQL